MHTPVRMCAACRKRLPKEELIRIVFTDEGVLIDPLGKLQGRGAYLCKDVKCIDKCAKKGALVRSLKRDIPAEFYETLRTYASGEKQA